MEIAGHCFFCFAGLILDDCLELSCLLLVFHKCNSKNNEIQKKPPYCMNVNYDCWLIRPSNNRSTDILGHVCFSRGKLALHVEQYLIYDYKTLCKKKVYMHLVNTWNCIYTEGEPNGLDLFPNFPLLHELDLRWSFLLMRKTTIFEHKMYVCLLLSTNIFNHCKRDWFLKVNDNS